jgi:hypothetical protein
VIVLRKRVGRLLSFSGPRRSPELLGHLPAAAAAPEVRDNTLRDDALREEAAVEAPTPAPKRRGRPLKNKKTAAIEALA